jgi:photosystem II stability/assembly factor-like uncharacterized protein
MKHFGILVTILWLSFSGIAQDWKQNLPEKNAGEQYSYFDYCNAFDAYWNPKQVNNKGRYLKDGVEKKAPGWKQFNRWAYFMEGQIDPKSGAFPEKTALQVVHDFEKLNPLLRESTTANWTSIGPNSSGGGYAGVGRINCIAFHPSDNNTYWVGAPSGGLWKTSDNGSSWVCLTDSNNVLGVSGIIVPSDYATSNTIYIATGDRDAFDNRSVGVLKSTDAGLTWNQTDLYFNLSQNGMVNKLLLDPNDNNTIIAATNMGVYKTTDAGSTWSTKLSDETFIDMEYKPGDFATLYGSTKNGAIYVSSNAGQTWTQAFYDASAYRIELAVTPANSSIVFAIASASDYGLYAIYKSSNSGAAYNEVFNGSTSNLMGWNSDGSDTGGQGFYDLSIAVSPTDSNFVIMGGVISHFSTNGGQSWTCSNSWTSGAPYNHDNFPVVHADKHNLDFRSNGDLFECNDGGLYLSQDNGSTWTDKTNGMVISQMYKLGVSATVENEIITGLQDNGSKLFIGGNWNDVTGGDGMECLIDYSNGNIQYATYVYGKIYRTLNSWNSRDEVQPTGAGDGAWVTPYIIDPNDAATLYAGYADVWKTTDRGDSWSQISTLNISDKIRAMDICESNNQVIMIAGRQTLYRTEDGGTTWNSVLGSLPVSTSYITDVTIQANNANRVWVTLSAYNTDLVYESTDGGASWSNISTGLPSIPAYSIVENIQSTEELHLYLGTELGIYVKKGSADWVSYNSNLPKVRIGEIEIYYDNPNTDNSKLFAATYGRGLWQSPLEPPVSNSPVVSTAFLTIAADSVLLSGDVKAEGSSAVTQRGIVYSTAANPTLLNTVVSDANGGIGEFLVTLRNLPSALYYAKAYAINSTDTSYGNQVTFNVFCDLEVQQVFTLGKVAIDFDTPQTVCARIVNNSEFAIDTAIVYLDITGDNPYAAQDTIFNFAAHTIQTVCIGNYSPTLVGNQIVEIFVDDDDNTVNNSMTRNMQTTLNTYSYADGEIADGGVGFSGGYGEFVAGFNSNKTGYLNQVDVNFFKGGNSFQVIVYDNSGVNGTPGNIVFESDTNISVEGKYTLLIDPVVEVPSGGFFVGVRQLTTTNVQFAFQREDPIRPNTFYYASPIGSTNWIDFAPDATFRFMIEPKFAQSVDVALMPIQDKKNFTNQTFDIPFEVINYGLDTALNIPVFYTIDNSRPYGPVTIVDSLAPGKSITGIFSDTIAFSQSVAGAYNFKVYTQLAADNIHANDTASFLWEIQDPPTFEPQYSSLDFGGILMTNSMLYSLTIANNGGSDLLIYEVQNSLSTFIVINIEDTIAQSNSWPYYVEFAPVDTGLYLDTLRFQTNIGEFRIPVQGEGLPEELLSANTLQDTNKVYAGKTTQAIIGLMVEVAPQGSYSPLSSITFNTNGTTQLTDISNAQVFFTGSRPEFSKAIPFGNTIENIASNFIVNGFQELQAGENYFWLSYNVAETAETGNTIDAECISFVWGKNYTPEITAPFGARTVTEFTGNEFTNFMAANLVIGQEDFYSQDQMVDQDGGYRLCGSAVSSKGVLAAISQNVNSGGGRIMLWNQVPEENGADADIVIGQPDFNAGNTGCSQTEINWLFGVAFSPDGNKLLVSDAGNNRVLVYNAPYYTNMPASVVIGQDDFVSNIANTDVNRLITPAGLHVHSDGRLFIADYGNNRVLVYNKIPEINGASANVVIGQPDFVSNTNGSGANQLYKPTDIAVSSDGKLIVNDPGTNNTNDNHRVLVYNTIPTTNGASADVVIGQTGFNQTGAGCSSTELYYTFGVTVSPDGKLAIGSFGNSRVLLYNSIPTENGAAADVVLGQPDFVSNTTFNGGIGPKSMVRPYSVNFDLNGRLFVNGRDMHRIMVYGEAPALSADLGLEFVINESNPGVNSNVEYTLSVTNHGTSDAGDIVINAALPYGIELTGTTASTGTYNPETGYWNINALNNGESAQLTFSGTIDESFSGSTISAFANILNSNMNDKNLTNNAATVQLIVDLMWLGNTADWSDAANWSINAVPNLTQSIVIPASPSGGNFPTLMSGGSAAINQLVIENGAKIELPVGTSLEVYGNYFNYGSDSTGSGVIEIKGNKANMVAGQVTNLLVENAFGVILSDSLTVHGQLSLIEGNVLLANNNLVLGQTSTIFGNFGTAAMLVPTGTGIVKKKINANSSFILPVGDIFETKEYAPVNFELLSNSAIAPGAFVSLNLTNQKHPEVLSSNNYLNRYWTLGASGISDIEYNVNLTYADNDLVGNETSIVGAKYNGSVKTTFGFVDNVNNTITLSNQTSFSDFTGIDGSAPYVVNVVSSSDGTYGEGAVIDIVVEFSKSVIVSGIPKLLLETGAVDGEASYVSGSNTNYLQFTYLVTANDASSDLDYASESALTIVGASIQDEEGNAAILQLPAPGNIGSLSSNNDIVLDNTPAPAVAFVSSTNNDGYYKVGDVLDVSVHFNKVVTVTGNPKIQMEPFADNQWANYISGSGTNVLHFGYTVPLFNKVVDFAYVSNKALVLNGGSIKDNLSNNADTTLPDPGYTNSLSYNTDIVIDSDLPSVQYVSAKSPDGKYGTNDIVQIQVVFTENVSFDESKGSPSLELETGSTDRLAIYVSGNGTNIFVFNYLIQTGDISTDLAYTSTSALLLNGTTIFDIAGNKASSELSAPGQTGSLSANSEIVIDTQVPYVLNVSSTLADGEYTTGDEIVLIVEFSKEVWVAGTPFIALNAGLNIRNAVYQSGSSSTVLNFAYTIQSGDYSADLAYISENALNLNGGSVKDDAGLDAQIALAIPGNEKSLSYNKQLVINTEPIVLNVYSSNVDKAYGLGSTINIAVKFNEVVTVDQTNGSPSLWLETGAADAQAVYVSGAGNIHNFEYTVVSGNESLDLATLNTSALELNGATIHDGSGKAAVLTLPVEGTPGSLSDTNQIVIDGIVPNVTSVYSTSADASYGAGAKILINVDFDEKIAMVYNGKVPELLLETGATDDSAVYISGTGTNTLVFEYTVQADDQSTDLAYRNVDALRVVDCSISDIVGNTAEITLPVPGAANSLSANSNIVIDNTQPAVVVNVSATNENGLYGIDDVIQVQVQYNKIVNVTGTPQLLIKNHETNPASRVDYSSGSGTNTLVFEYSVVANDNASDLSYESNKALVLNGGSIKDNAAVDADTTLVMPGATYSLSFNKDIALDGTVPSVANITSTNFSGTYSIGQTLEITIEYSEVVEVNTNSGIPSLSLETGDVDRNAFYTSGSGTNVLIFEYEVQAGDESNDLSYHADSLELNGGSITDFAGNNAAMEIPEPGTTGSLSFNKAIVVDGKIPEVTAVSTTKPNGVYNQGETVDLLVSISEKVFVDTLTGVPSIVLNTTPAANAYYKAGSGSNLLLFTYEVGAGENVTKLDYVQNGGLMLNNGKIKDAVGNLINGDLPTNNTLINNHSIGIDNVCPTIKMLTASAITNSSSVTVAIEFSERVTELTHSMLQFSNCTFVSLVEEVSKMKWVLTVAPKLVGEVKVEVKANVVADTAGNMNALRGLVFQFDNEAPIATLATSVSNPTLNSEIPVSLTFSEKISGFAYSDLDITNGTAQNFVEVEEGKQYTFNVIATTAGDVTVQLPENAVVDPAGNQNPASNLISVEYVIVPLNVSVSSNVSGFTNSNEIELFIEFSELVSGFSVDNITLGNASIGSFTNEVADKKWKVSLVPIQEGEVTAQVLANEVTGDNGTKNNASNMYSVVYDATTPVLTLSSGVGGYSNAEKVTVNVSISEAVSGFALEGLILVNATVENLVEVIAGESYTFDLVPTDEGEVSVTVAAAKVSDNAGNQNAESNTISYIYDATAPVLTLSSEVGEYSNAGKVTVSVGISELVSGFALEDLILVNATVENLVEVTAGESYTFDLVPTDEGEVSVTVAAAKVSDNAGNQNAESNTISYIYDATAPVLTLSSEVGEYSNAEKVTVSVGISELVSGFALEDLTLVNATAENLEEVTAGESYTFDLLPMADGEVSVTVASAKVSDNAGNENAESNTISYIYDATAPGATQFFVVEEGSYEALFGIEMDENANVYVLVIEAGETAPSVDQIKAGLNADNQEVDTYLQLQAKANEYFEKNINGLQQGTNYKAYLVAEDSLGNSSENAIMVEFTTLDDAIRDFSIEELIIYPNPGNGLFYISNVANALQGAEIIVTNNAGDIVRKVQLSTDKTAVNLNTEVPGVYHVIIKKNNVVRTMQYILK